MVARAGAILLQSAGIFADLGPFPSNRSRPLLFGAYEDQYNLYAYVGNDPVNFTDPTGMCGKQSGEDLKQYDAFCEVIEKSGRSDELVETTSDTLSRVQISVIEKKVGFSEEGPGEKGVALRNPIDGYTAFQDGTKAKADGDAFGGTVGDAGDAIRHVSWNIRMQRSVGTDKAQTFADAIECRPNNELGDRTMDLINNHNARILSQIFPNTNPYTLSKAALNAGLIQRQKIKVK